MSSDTILQAAADARGLLRLTAPVELQAAAGEGKRPTFRMTAYTGGALPLAGWYSPVVVDLAGAKSAPSLPILRDHDAGRIVGHAESVKITAKAITAEGTISGVGAAADEVIASSKNGFPWQASIGAQPGRLERVEAGAKVTVNGRSFNGPLLVARDVTLREISFVAIGADGNTSATVAAQGGAMTFDQWLESRGFDPATITDRQRAALQAAYNAEQGGGGADAVQAERQRIMRIDALCRGEWGDQARRVEQLRQQAIAGTTTVEAIQAELLTVLRASRATTPAAGGGGGGIDQGQLLTASLLISQGVRPDFVALHYGQRIADAALSRANRAMSVQGLMRQVIAAAGGHVPSGRFTDGTIRTAFECDRTLRAGGFSTLSLPGILSDAANKMLLESFQGAGTTWGTFARRGSAPDFKAGKRYRLTGNGQFEEVGKAGEIHHVSLDESEYTAQLSTFGAMLALTRQDIINDDLGAMSSVPRVLGRMGAVKIERAVYELLLSNPSSFFGSGNANYISGATTVLAAEGLRQAFQRFLEQSDSNGDPLLVAPKVLLVPPALQATALALANSNAIVVSGGTDQATLPAGNVWAGQFTPVVSPYLAVATGLSGASDTAWYLLAGPGDYAVVEVCFLNGVESPTVEQGDVDFNKLGIQFRAYHDFGVNVLDHRGGVMSKGAN